MLKVLAFTAIRSEYDLLSSLYILLNKDPAVEFKVLVSGAHLSKKHGYTIKDIERDGLEILGKVKTIEENQGTLIRLKSAANLFEKSIDIIADYRPDIVIYAGDREEVIVASTIAGYMEIPSIHFYGGDHVSDSHIDNPIRHATSKLSSAHFVSTEEHKNRLIAMGEEEKRIYNIGSIALDKFNSSDFYSKETLIEKFSIKNGFKTFALLIFHPIPKERKVSAKVFENILLSLIETNMNTFVSYPNIDPGNTSIIKVIEKYKDHQNFIFYMNQPRDVFMSIYKNASFIIGNSSSGVLESASIPIPAINVGYRQTGRTANDNIVFSGTSKEEIKKSINKINTLDFRTKVQGIKSIFGDGKSAKRALDLIKTIDFNSLLFKDKDALNLKK